MSTFSTWKRLGLGNNVSKCIPVNRSLGDNIAFRKVGVRNRLTLVRRKDGALCGEKGCQYKGDQRDSDWNYRLK